MADDHLAKAPPLAEETKLRDKGRIWRKRKKLEEKERIKKIDKIWNLDFVSLNRPDTR